MVELCEEGPVIDCIAYLHRNNNTSQLFLDSVKNSCVDSKNVGSFVFNC